MSRATPYLLAAIAALFLSITSFQHATAALIVYEGFRGYNAGTLTGQGIGASTVGLDTNAAWVSSTAGTQWNAVATGGLTIGSGAATLATSPGAVVHTGGSSVLAAKLDIANYTGTLYASYLVSMNLDVGTSGPPNGVVYTVIGEGATTSNRRFRTSVRHSSNATTATVSVHYTSDAPSATGSVQVDDTTFMMLSRFTRVGEQVNATTPGVSDLWALSSAQFEHFKSNNFVGIDGATVGPASNQVTGRASHTYTTSNLLALNDTFSYQLINGLGTNRPHISFDEVRLGSSFAAVTPVVPEPMSHVLFLIGIGTFCRLRRKRSGQTCY